MASLPAEYSLDLSDDIAMAVMDLLWPWNNNVYWLYKNYQTAFPNKPIA